MQVPQTPRPVGPHASPPRNTISSSTPSNVSSRYPDPHPQSQPQSHSRSPSQTTPVHAQRVRISQEEAVRAQSARVGRRLQAGLIVLLLWSAAKVFRFSLTDLLEPFLRAAPVLGTVYSFSRVSLAAAVLYSFASAAYFILVGPTAVAREIPAGSTSIARSNSTSVLDSQRNNARSSPKTRPSPSLPSSPSLYIRSNRSSPGSQPSSDSKMRYRTFPPRSPSRVVSTPTVGSSASPHDLRRALLQNRENVQESGHSILDAYKSRNIPVASPDLHRSFVDRQSRPSV